MHKKKSYECELRSERHSQECIVHILTSGGRKALHSAHSLQAHVLTAASVGIQLRGCILLFTRSARDSAGALCGETNSAKSLSLCGCSSEEWRSSRIRNHGGANDRGSVTGLMSCSC